MSSYVDIRIILKMGSETIEFDNNRLTAFEIVKTFNDHAKISFKGEVTANQDKYYEMAAYEVQMEVYFNPANTLIFNGTLTRITVHPNREERTVQVEMEGASYTYYLDESLLNRAFQDQTITYQTLVDTITNTYNKAMGEALANADKPIETFTLQYQETDWQFLKRMASRLHTGLVPEVTRENLKFYFGMPELKERGVLKKIAPFYGIRKRLLDYRELIADGVLDIVEDDFITYHFKTDELFNIGDYVYLDPNNKTSKLYVYQATMTLEGSLFRCYCKVSPLNGLQQKKTYNPKITGLSLEGKVIETGGPDSSKDYVKVLLPIDVSTDKEKACWFRYTTPYTAAGNTGWYWMPEVNDTVMLYFPTCKEEAAMVTTSVRRQESESERLQDPNVAYLRTGFEKELMFKEGQITLTGKDQGLHIYLDQKQGVIIESPTTLTLQADNNLTLEAGRDFVISAQGDESAIQLNYKDGKANSLVLDADGEIRFKGKVEKERGSGETPKPELNPIKTSVPVETAVNTVPSSEKAPEHSEQTGEKTPDATNTAESTTHDTDSTEGKKLTLEDLIEKIKNGEIDLDNSKIDDLLKEYNVAKEDAIKVIKEAVNYVVSQLPTTTATDPNKNQVDLVELPFNDIMGLHYEKHAGTICSWGKPDFVEKIMVIGLYWNYLNSNSYIAYNDLSNKDLSVVRYLSGPKKGEKAHSSHQKGRQVDFDIILSGSSVTDVKRAEAGTTNSVYLKGDPNYLKRNRAIIKDFFKMVNSVYPATFYDVLWCDTSVSNLINKKINSNQYLRWLHANHIHMGF